MARIKYERLPYQRDFDESTKFYDVLCAGYGAGKTYALVMKLLKLAAINRGLPGGILAPTTKMFRRDVLPTFQDICKNSGLRMRWFGSEGVIYLPDFGCRLYVFHAEDKGESIRGPSLAFGGVNEATLVNEQAFLAFLSRMRLKEAKLLQIPMSGTPEGFNWFYNMFISEPRKDTDVFYGDMRLNSHVADVYAQILIDSYDDIMQQQYVAGKFINTTHGSALYKFNRAKHTASSVKQNPNMPIWVSLDFNVAPMSATLYNRYPDKSLDRVLLRGFDEVNLKGADTWQLADIICEKAGVDPGQIVLFPDGIGGSQQRTSAKDNISDIEIMRSKGFKDIRYKVSLSVRDCLNASNSFLAKNRVILDKDKCKETIKDWEQCVIKPGTHELDKKDKFRTHWVDGFKNMVDYEWPITTGAGGWKQVQVR